MAATERSGRTVYEPPNRPVCHNRRRARGLAIPESSCGCAPVIHLLIQEAVCEIVCLVREERSRGKSHYRTTSPMVKTVRTQCVRHRLCGQPTSLLAGPLAGFSRTSRSTSRAPASGISPAMSISGSKICVPLAIRDSDKCPANS